ncbi:MAG: phosphate ABC transporter permease PstA [Chloroflexi bacterium]|nr:phosphate ABC transporter permease PstA [Chloroflexota bacterium]MCI0576537.1 phosphate ABC transporter permease PstA [Chloroflexota bacterium]MCI0648805.1 phosphate ABC transporter permease PstA [Chloroflexota bacterium]MCI0726307.1 phosphate ABC transporter permease PstA [Chloroflexota bacterium]
MAAEYKQGDGYPEGEALRVQVRRRHRGGLWWRLIFQVSTIIGIITLMALLYNITNQAFGLVAVENEKDPASLVLAYEEGRLLGASNTVASEDDNELAQGIVGNPYAIGFFGYAYYQQNQDALRALAVDGQEPTAETVENGQYPLARPLFIYTTAGIMAEKPQVAALVNYYLAHANEAVAEVGYFPASPEELQEAQNAWLAAQGLEGETLPVVNPADYEGEIIIAGSSTVFPLTQRVLERFRADGFAGPVTLDNIGSTAGLRRFCVEGSSDIANASRPITPDEFAACRAIGRQPLEIRVSTDALAVVASVQNDFLSGVSQEELGQLFTTAVNWSDVNPAWPAEPIQRFIPGADSGTLDFFTETIFPQELADLPKETLLDILAANISTGLGRRLEREQRFFDDWLVFENPDLFAEVCASAEPPAGCVLPARGQDDVYRLVLERVVVPNVVQTWSLVDSLFNRSGILLQVQQKYPNAVLEFRSWVTPAFISSPQSSEPELAGVRTAILGSLWVIAITILFAFPIGVGAAVYLEEYAGDSWFNRMIQTNINNLAGVPSIIYGMLGLAIFVRVLEALTSGATFGAIDDSTTANGRTILSASLTLGLLILPLIIINAQEAIRAVPGSLRQASYGVGATKWQTIWSHVLPNALPGILTGTILAMSRAIGETAPLVVVGASTFITADPEGPFSKFTTLPIQIYQWTARPQAEFRNIAAAAIIILLILLLSLNATAIILRNKTSKKMV